MRKHCKIAVLLLAAVLLCFLSARGKAAQAEEGEKKYKITVSGGFASTDWQNPEENVITEAAPGEYVYIFANRKAGTYVKGWNSQQVSANNYVTRYELGRYAISFQMPAKDVTFTAVTAAQKPFTIDLTDGYMKLPDTYYHDSDVDNLIEYWICQAAGMGSIPYYGCIIDLDKDGTEDVRLCGRGGMRAAASFEVVPLSGCSIHGEYKCDNPCEGPLWPFIFKFGSEPVEKNYKITVTGGKATEGYSGDTAITEAAPGTLLYLGPDEEDGYYVTGWSLNSGKAADPRFVQGDSRNYWTFFMPAKNIEIRAIRENQTPYTIDLTGGTAEVPDEIVRCLNESIGFGYSQEGTDLDGDGTRDVLWVSGEKSTIVPLSESGITGEYVINKHNYGKYWPITIRFGEIKKEYSITVSGGHAVDSYGKTITHAAPGEEVILVRDSEAGKFWKEWKADFAGFTPGIMYCTFVMPAKDVTIQAVTVSKQTPVTIDLTAPLLVMDEKDSRALILKNAFSANAGYYFYAFNIFGGGEVGNWLDLDGNGTFDIGCGQTFDPFNPYVVRGDSYSLGVSYSFPVKDGAYGPIIFRVDEKKTDKPLPKRNGNVHQIECADCVALNEKGEEITEARTGEVISFRLKNAASHFTRTFAISEKATNEYMLEVEFNGKTLMPDCDILVKPPYTPELKPAYVIDLRPNPTEGGVSISLDNFVLRPGIDIPSMLGSNGKAEDGIQFIDLDGDGKADIQIGVNYRFGGWICKRTENATQKEIILPITDKTEEICMYSAIRFLLVPADITLRIYVDEKEVSDFEGVSLNYIGSNMIEVEVLQGEGTYEGYHIRLDQINYRSASSTEQLFDYSTWGMFPNAVHHDYPAEDCTITVVYQSTDKPTPTPTPTATPVPTKEPTGEPSETPEGTPKAEDGEKDDRARGRDSEDGFNPLLLIIPAVVLAAGSVALILFFRKNKTNGGGDAAATEPSQDGGQAEGEPSVIGQPEVAPQESTQTEAIPQESAPTEGIPQENDQPEGTPKESAQPEEIQQESDQDLSQEGQDAPKDNE